MKKLFDKFVYFIYKKCESYLFEYTKAELDYDFWGFLDD